MRMWMVEPKMLCTQHLLGEHVECHMFAGVLKKKVSLNGYIDHDCFELSSLEKRHKDLVEEMERRGMNHKSPLIIPTTEHLPDKVIFHRINRKSSEKNLLDRCSKCTKI